MGKIADALAGLDPAVLAKIESIGADIQAHEDAMTTLVSGETWKDIHDLLKANGPEMEDPDVIHDLFEVAHETSFASKMFKDAYETVEKVLKTIGVDEEEIKNHMSDAKGDLADALNTMSGESVPTPDEAAHDAGVALDGFGAPQDMGTKFL